MAAIHIRRAVPTDLMGLAACIDAAYAKYKARVRDMPAVSEGCAKDIANNEVWLATQNEKIVGALILIPEAGFMKLANIAVHPGHAGKGIGGQLIALAESSAKEQGFSEMRLNTHIAMPENIALYGHLGWEEISRDGNTVSMIKKI